MNDSALLTSHQMAQLLSVHESSIKRWCREGSLACDTTEGGHRRIALEDLLVFARKRGMDCRLLEFGSWYGEVWEALRLARHKDDYSCLLDLTYDWIKDARSALAHRLFDFCIEHGIGYGALFDEVLAQVLHRVGNEWHAGRLEIGEEHRITGVILDSVHRLRFALGRISDEESNRVALVGTCEGNMHDLGAQAVRLVLEANGWRVIYVGANVPARDYAMLQTRHRAQIVCISIVPPSVVSDSVRIVEVLGRFYREEQPYYLVLGGSGPLENEDRQFAPSSFLGVETLTSIATFESWLKTADFSPFKHASL